MVDASGAGMCSHSGTVTLRTFYGTHPLLYLQVFSKMPGKKNEPTLKEQD